MADTDKDEARKKAEEMLKNVAIGKNTPDVFSKGRELTGKGIKKVADYSSAVDALEKKITSNAKAGVNLAGAAARRVKKAHGDAQKKADKEALIKNKAGLKVPENKKVGNTVGKMTGEDAGPDGVGANVGSQVFEKRTRVGSNVGRMVPFDKKATSQNSRDRKKKYTVADKVTGDIKEKFGK